MYGPDRADHLMYYRHDAPSDLSIDKEEMATMTLPQISSTRRCN